MRFEDALPLMRKGIVCNCGGANWTVNEHNQWLRWYGTSYRIESGPSNDQILGGEWASETQDDSTKTKLEKYGEAFSRCMASNTPPAGMQVISPNSRLEIRLAYLERLHDVVHHDGPIEPPSYRQIMKHTGDLWRDENR